MPNLTVSIRNDELAEIDKIIGNYNGMDLTRHEVIKLAIRYFLFPDEVEHILNGKKAVVIDRIHLHPLHKDQSPNAINFTKDFPVWKERKIAVVHDKEAEKDPESRKRVKAQVEEAMRRDGLL